MSRVSELIIVFGMVAASVWLPGAVIAKAARIASRRPNTAARPNAGPAMDL
jgi:hypothetical protein